MEDCKELRNLLRECVMRAHLALPENEQDKQWFDSGANIKDNQDFIIELYTVLGLGQFKRNSKLSIDGI